MTFSSLGLSKPFLGILAEQGYTAPYPIQAQAIPAILEKKDILGIAKTGSGKTASYVLPILQLLETAEKQKNRHVKALVLVPTRELAVQVNEVFKTFEPGAAVKMKSLAVFGGTSINMQMMSMQNVDILVATPGRLLELVEVNAVHLNEIKILVIDEADKLLNTSFTKEFDRILGLLPAKRQNLLFSATLNKEITELNKLMLNQPEVINIEEKEENIELIDQSAYLVEDSQKGPLLRHLIDELQIGQALIFASSVARADRVADKLRRNGIDAQSIHSRKSQGARTDLLTKFKNKKIPILVATDLLALGIDIEDLPFVINYELPRSPKVFIHRIGRTGRAETSGKAISFISPEEEPHFYIIQKKMKKRVKLINAKEMGF
ncbi:MAG: DEAD/DEAH box helicase [Spirochaetales bacterium]|nr:DEAD/DEAH box helicase [Spirochaetales bacterium]